MNLLKKFYASLLTTLFVGVLAVILFAVQSSFASTAPFEAKDFCKSGDTNCVKEDKTGRVGTISCPEGTVIHNLYVHAGDGQTVYQLPESGFDVSYSNGGRTATVTVTTFQHDLSWLGVTCGTAPTATPTPTPTVTPTPTPTVTPTPTPTVTPTPTITPTPTVTPTPTPVDGCPEGQVYDGGLHICIQCDGGGTCEVNTGGTPTPTPTPTVTTTPTPTLTPTPTPGSSNNGNNNSNNNSSSNNSSSNNSSSNNTSSNASTPNTSGPQILGANTFGGTGTFEDSLSNMMLITGILTSGAGVVYGKKKSKKAN